MVKQSYLSVDELIEDLKTKQPDKQGHSDVAYNIKKLEIVEPCILLLEFDDDYSEHGIRVMLDKVRTELKKLKLKNASVRAISKDLNITTMFLIEIERLQLELEEAIAALRQGD